MFCYIDTAKMIRGKQAVKSNNAIDFHGLVKLIICLTIVIFPSCSGNVVSFLEKEQAYLNFTYYCESDIYEVVLQAGYKPPFYHSRNGGSLSLPPDQEDRFIVEDANCSYGCSLNLTITNVQKEDAGTYTCFVYKDTERVQEYIQIGMHVDYPPGKASCELSTQHHDGNWGSMQCTATVGSLSGQMECYQNGERMPALTKPTETNTSLKQTILIKYSNVVLCCSATFRQPKGICECNDTAIDPITNRQLTGLKHACTTTTPGTVFIPSPSQTSMVSKETTFTASHIPSVESNQTHVTHLNIPVIWGSVVGFLVIVIMFLAVIVGRYCWGNQQSDRKVDYGRAETSETEL